MQARTTAYAATAALLILGALFAFGLLGRPTDFPLRELLKERGKIAVLGENEMLEMHAEGTELVPIAELPRIERLINRNDAPALARAMTEAGIDGLLVLGGEAAGSKGETTLFRRLERYESIDRLKAEFLATDASLFLLDAAFHLPESSRQALAVVARALLGGARPPRIDSFPEPLRRSREVELMVLVSKRGSPRLWRSARGSSVAQALLTAARAARRRWMKREHALGGRLEEVLASLDVEVSLLRDDGTIASPDRGFIERVVEPEHGIAFELGGKWRYLLPEARRLAAGNSAVDAYRQLLAREGLSESALDRDDIRLYRLLVVPLASSPATSHPPAPAPGPAPVTDAGFDDSF